MAQNWLLQWQGKRQRDNHNTLSIGIFLHCASKDMLINNSVSSISFTKITQLTATIQTRFQTCPFYLGLFLTPCRILHIFKMSLLDRFSFSRSLTVLSELQVRPALPRSLSFKLKCVRRGFYMFRPSWAAVCAVHLSRGEGAPLVIVAIK